MDVCPQGNVKTGRLAKDRGRMHLTDRTTTYELTEGRLKAKYNRQRGKTTTHRKKKKMMNTTNSREMTKWQSSD